MSRPNSDYRSTSPTVDGALAKIRRARTLLAEGERELRAALAASGPPQNPEQSKALPFSKEEAKALARRGLRKAGIAV